VRGIEIVPGCWIVYDNGFEAPGAEKMLMTVTFDEHDGGTTLTIDFVLSAGGLGARIQMAG